MSEEKTKYCHSCGAMIPYFDRYCPACGAPQPALSGMEPVKQVGVKKVWVAVLLSFLITGAGQLYLGEYRRGTTFMLGTLLIGAALSYYFTQDQIMGFGVAMALISAYDAYRRALLKQRV